MTRLAFVADVHLGNHKRFGGGVESSLNLRAREGLDVLRRAVAHARELSCSTFAVLGDLFDTSRPEPQLLAAVQRIFEHASPMRIVVMLGNHEQVSSAEGDHALGPLAPLVHVVERPELLMVDGIDLALLPFRRGRAADWLPGAIEELTRGSRKATLHVLGLHLGISDGSTAPWLREAHDSIDVDTLGDLAEAAGVGTVVAGNWHDRRIWRPGPMWQGPTVFQLGALVPTGFDNPGLEGYGTLAVVDDRAVETVSFHEVHGPRFVKLAQGQHLAARGMPHRIYVSATATRDRIGETSTALGNQVAAGNLAGVEVLPDVGENRASARAAAGAAKAADTFDEALASFVAAMAVPEGVDRDDVLGRAQGYLGRAR